MSHIYHVSHPSGEIEASVALPGSKSESNRALILHALAGREAEIINLSEAEDTRLLAKILSRGGKMADVKDCGTCMRFLLAYYCVINKNKIITGSSALCQRPVGKLVNALRNIGFKLNYVRNEGFPPVEVIPVENKFLKDTVTIESNESSQYISSLAMIAPVLNRGLTIHCTGARVSNPYIELTIHLMKRMEISAAWKKNSLIIKNQKFTPAVFEVESDWSSASYWYSIASIASRAEITLAGLRSDSMQGDKIIAEWMKKFGIQTEYDQQQIRIKKVSEPLANEMDFDFSDHPDLAMTIITLAAVKNIKLSISGVSTLKHKESDRIAGLTSELKKINGWLTQTGDDRYELKSNYRRTAEHIETFGDHRMVMSFAPLGIAGEINIVQPLSVTKSYPRFWDDLRSAGFNF